MEDAYDSDKYGHAKYSCAATMVDDYEQYDKAEPYLWCVLGHCGRCDGDDDDGSGSGGGSDCPTAGVGLYSNTTCVSATYNYLGFVERKKTAPDYVASEEYYRKSISLWPSNCGALSYLTELYLTIENETLADETLQTLCDRCGTADESADVESALEAFDNSAFSTPDYEACGRDSDDSSEASESTASTALIAGCVAGGVVLLGAAGTAFKSKLMNNAKTKGQAQAARPYEKATAVEMAPVSVTDQGQIISRGAVSPDYSDV